MPRVEYNTTYFRLTHTIEAEPPHPTIPHDYYDDTYTLTIVIKGKGTCSVEGNVYQLCDGDMMLLSPDEIRSFKFENEGYHERLSIYFSESILLPLLEYDPPLTKAFHRRSFGLGNKCSVDLYRSEYVISIIKDIKEFAAQENDPINTARLHILLLQFLFWIYDSRKLYKTYNDSAIGDSIAFEICNYIKNNLDKDLSYEHLQNAMLVSRYQLTNVFAHNIGMTLTEYIIRKRLSKVISLVVGGDGIENAAYRAGFHTYSNFYKKFVKYYKVSPHNFFKNKSKINDEN